MMSKKTYFSFWFIATFFLTTTLFAQQGDYTIHVIQKGETLSGIARQHKTSVAQILKLNGLTPTSKLKIGLQLKVPTKAEVKTKPKPEVHQQVKDKPIAKSKPVINNATVTTHVVEPKESLYRISKTYNVSVEKLREWNNLTNDNIKAGQVLVVAVPSSMDTTILINCMSINDGKTASSKDAKVIHALPLVVNTEVKPLATTNPGTKKETVVAFMKDTVKAVSMDAKQDVIKQEIKKEATPESKPETTVVDKSAGMEGAFSTQFRDNDQKMTGIASTFKTASGWLDRKYYVLMNNAEIGTIVKVIANSRAIYAKVLGPLPNIKEDDGLLLRISNAAASALGIIDPKFNVAVNY